MMGDDAGADGMMMGDGMMADGADGMVDMMDGDDAADMDGEGDDCDCDCADCGCGCDEPRNINITIEFNVDVGAMKAQAMAAAADAAMEPAADDQMTMEMVMPEPEPMPVCQPPLDLADFMFVAGATEAHYWNLECECCIAGDNICIEDNMIVYPGVDCLQDLTLCPIDGQDNLFGCSADTVADPAADP